MGSMTPDESTWFQTGVVCAEMENDPEQLLIDLAAEGKVPPHGCLTCYFDGYFTALALEKGEDELGQ